MVGALDALVAYVAPAGAQLGEPPVAALDRHRRVGGAVGDEHPRVALLQILEAVAAEEAAPAPVGVTEPELLGALRIGEHRVPFLERLLAARLGVARRVARAWLRG